MIDKAELQRYLNRRMQETGIYSPTADQLNQFLNEWMQVINSRPLEAFDGFSSSDMHHMLYFPFEKNCPVQFANFTGEDCHLVPLFRQLRLLLEMIEKEESVKLTPKGNLPVYIVKELYAVGVPDELIEYGLTRLRSEDNARSVQLTRIVAELMGIVKKRHNRYSLTERGKELMKDNRELLSRCLITLFTKINMAAFDGYRSDNIGVVGNCFSLVLLYRYGNQEREVKFYADKYFQAFPDLFEEADDRYRSREENAMNCYSLRVFKRLFCHLGLVEIREESEKSEKSEKGYPLRDFVFIRGTDVIKRLFIIKKGNIS